MRLISPWRLSQPRAAYKCCTTLYSEDLKYVCQLQPLHPRRRRGYPAPSPPRPWLDPFRLHLGYTLAQVSRPVRGRAITWWRPEQLGTSVAAENDHRMAQVARSPCENVSRLLILAPVRVAHGLVASSLGITTYVYTNVKRCRF